MLGLSANISFVKASLHASSRTPRSDGGNLSPECTTAAIRNENVEAHNPTNVIMVGISWMPISPFKWFAFGGRAIAWFDAYYGIRPLMV